MLTKWDEMMCHQLPTTMAQVHTDNPEWTERIYVSIYNVRDKNTILGFGVGQYPNKNRAGRLRDRLASGQAV